ncbi:MAG: helix-turn-helix domain-containing protein [Methanoregulaceae archaeon]
MKKAPCQTIVWDILPAIRAAIAAELVQNGVSQLEVAKMLDMTPSAVSQYLTKKRGYRVEFEDDVKESVRLLAEKIKAGKCTDIVAEMCGICRQLRSGEGSCAGN